MKRVVLILVVLMVAFALSAQVKVGGSTAATVYSDAKGAGTFDSDQNVNISAGPFALALNAGFTRAFVPVLNTVSWTYLLSASQPVGPFTFGGSIGSDSMSFPIGGKFVGDILDDIIIKADFVTGPVGVNAYSYFSAKKGYDIFQTADVSAFVAPKWGAFRVGMLYMKAQAVTDDVGHPNSVAAVKDLSFYAKATVTY